VKNTVPAFKAIKTINFNNLKIIQFLQEVTIFQH